MTDVEIMARVERRREWSAREKAALLAEVEAEGGKVTVVARRHGISESLLYNWRAAWKAAAAVMQAPVAPPFIPLGVIGASSPRDPAVLAQPEQPEPPRPGRGGVGGIEIALPNGARVSVDAFVNEQALACVLRAIRGAT